MDGIDAAFLGGIALAVIVLLWWFQMDESRWPEPEPDDPEKIWVADSAWGPFYQRYPTEEEKEAMRERYSQDQPRL